MATASCSRSPLPPSPLSPLGSPSPAFPQAPSPGSRSLQAQRPRRSPSPGGGAPAGPRPSRGGSGWVRGELRVQTRVLRCPPGLSAAEAPRPSAAMRTRPGPPPPALTPRGEAAPAAPGQRPEQDGFELDSNTNKEQALSLNGDSDKWIDFSKIYSSNQEYYLKLKELKNAHLETMAKLKTMYRNKLYLRGVQPLDKKNAPNICCRPTWDKSLYQPLHLHKSFSDSDLSDPLGSTISDGTDSELAFEENSSETGSSAFAKQRIEKMWDGFSVEDYISRTKHSLPSSPAFRMIRKKEKAWSPKVTVPRPFQMTLREAKKKEQNVKSKSQMEMENNLLKKQLEEEAECQKKFRANPVPAAVFLPLYREIVQRNEERRKSVKERSKVKLLASQRPFKFIEREKQRNEIRKMQLKDLSAPEKKTKLFKAKPVPKCVYSPAVNDRLKEEELYREIRIRMRAEELLRNSSVPNSRLALTNSNKRKKHNCIEPKETEHKPKIKSSVPDFDLLHQKFQKRLLQQKQVKHLTVCEPFDLRTPYIPSNKGKILKDIQEDEEKLKETRWPYASPRCKPQMRNTSTNSRLSGRAQSKSPKITESTRQRLQAIRNSLEDKRKLEEQQKRKKTKQKQRTKKLQKIVSTRAEANDPHQSLAQMSKSKLKTFRDYEKQRMQEYLQELREMKERVKQRPLLFERVTQKNARIAAEKHYSNRLRALGLCPEFVSKKGQTTKSLQCSSAEDFSNSTPARERVVMDKVKEREAFEEAADSNPHSEQFCDEEEKRKGEEASTQDGQSSELEDEEEARASPDAQQPRHAGETGSSPTSDQHREEEEEKNKDEEQEASAGLPLGHSQEEEEEEEEEDDDHSRPSSQSDQSHECEQGQSDPEAEGSFGYEDEEYESDDSEEKPSDDEAD
ncbi:protein FAM161A [Phaenicophaeus curvirostris]|uniref:protein FAM161A n=1 Tax=Phaenicophaeus curvirostris TaxID=33595 RepID=UPI0037F098C0